MKEIFLSFRPEFFKPILYGMKKYEYRKRFCNEETRAYLYLSGNKQMVIGIMELGVPIRLDKTLSDYKEYPLTFKRVNSYVLNREICAIPIKSLTLFKEPIKLSEIKGIIPDFRPPRMYYIVNDNTKLKSILSKRELRDIEFIHGHDSIYYDNLAMSVKEMVETPKFKRIDAVIDKMSDYKDIL